MREKTDYSALPLGKSVDYPEAYDPSQLQGISRAHGRQALAFDELPLMGCDLWNAYELSWLDAKGKPKVACAQFEFSAESPNMVESKSLKLYLNSFNQTRFDSAQAVARALKLDLAAVAGSEVLIALYAPDEWLQTLQLRAPEGCCLDDFDVADLAAEPSADLLFFSGKPGCETYYSNLFRSRCPVTGQPDWATVEIEISGNLPKPAALLSYLLSYRNNDEFHEQCVERIFTDIFHAAKPERLTVYARYTRRGGLDINPLRSTHETHKPFERLPRQ
ncbi:MAG: 7-cyano-7-deazaguanine reductase [Bermanella sp.]